MLGRLPYTCGSLLGCMMLLRTCLSVAKEPITILAGYMLLDHALLLHTTHILVTLIRKQKLLGTWQCCITVDKLRRNVVTCRVFV